MCKYTHLCLCIYPLSTSSLLSFFLNLYQYGFCPSLHLNDLSQLYLGKSNLHVFMLFDPSAEFEAVNHSLLKIFHLAFRLSHTRGSSFYSVHSFIWQISIKTLLNVRYCTRSWVTRRILLLSCSSYSSSWRYYT